MESKSLDGIYPAVIKSYNHATRTCKIAIEGFTNGAEEELEADLNYPLGDKSKQGNYSTEIEILANDLVWVMFIGGDARYPLVTGYRNPQTGNSADWRRWHHKNIQAIADTEIKLTVGNAEISVKTDKIKVSLGGSTIEVTSGGIKLNGSKIDLN
jgi:hypothetical protein